MIVGSGPAVVWFSKLYFSSLAQFRRNGWFFGKDQSVFGTLVGLYPDSFLLVELFNFEQRCAAVDRWFGFTHFMQQTHNRHPQCRSTNPKHEAGTLTNTREACYLGETTRGDTQR